LNCAVAAFTAHTMTYLVVCTVDANARIYSAEYLNINLHRQEFYKQFCHLKSK